MHFSATQSTQNPGSTDTNQFAGNASPFSHQSYTAAAPCVPCHYLRSASPAGGPAEFRRRMRSVGD
ncbi:MAG TPA: hypothetical protein PK867_22655, partial [Pirellulales bacterium]|nr:hypothetical protein [Pirellulales bacterium]